MYIEGYLFGPTSFNGIIGTGNTDTLIVLPNTYSSIDDAYKDFFIQIISGIDVNIRRITSYNGTTFTATLNNPLTFTPIDQTSIFHMAEGTMMI
jgi:hypothetical protein